MPKALKFDNDPKKGWEQIAIFCPGCKYLHTFTINSPASNGAIWTFNGNFEKPTFNPSMLVNKDYPESRCHSFVRDGRIEFLSDCFHELKNQTVDLPDIGEPWI